MTALEKSIRRSIGYGDVKHTKPKRKKKSDRKLAKDYADRCCREYAKKRWKACVTCGSTENLQWAHLLTSAAESTRWDAYNFAVQCRNCNFRHEHDFSRMMIWFLNTYGQMAYEDLVQLHHTPAHYKTADLEAIGDHYKKLIEEMK